MSEKNNMSDKKEIWREIYKKQKEALDLIETANKQYEKLKYKNKWFQDMIEFLKNGVEYTEKAYLWNELGLLGTTRTHYGEWHECPKCGKRVFVYRRET